MPTPAGGMVEEERSKVWSCAWGCVWVFVFGLVEG